MPVCRTPEERFFFQQLILDRIAVDRPGQSYHYVASTPQAGGELMLECFRRLDVEGNRALLEVPAELVPELARLQAENRRLKRGLAQARRELQAKRQGPVRKFAAQVRRAVRRFLG